MTAQISQTRPSNLNDGDKPPLPGLILPRLISMRLVSFRSEDGRVTAFEFEPKRLLRFKAGQHGLLFVPKGGFKPLSLASSPSNKTITIATRLDSGSKFKLALGSLRPGDKVRLLAPLMNFTVPLNAPAVVFLAQGVGITPIRSMLLDLRERCADTLTRLIHVGNGHAFRRETQHLAGTSVYPTNAQEFLSELTRAVGEAPTATFMVSGAPDFITSTNARLVELGVPVGQIKHDSMTGY